MKHSNLAILISALSCCSAIVLPAMASTTTPVTDTTSAISESTYLATLRSRWANYFLGDPAQTFDQGLKRAVAKINTQAEGWLKNLTASKNGLWQDIPLDADSGDGRLKLGAQLYASYKRLFTLARAYKMPGGKLAGDPKLRDALIDSLTTLNHHYYHVGAAEWGNWWHWQLGIGRVANNIMVILYDDVPTKLVKRYIETSRYFVPRPTHLSEGYGAPYSSSPLMFESTGGNRTDNAQIVLIRGILDNNPDEIKSAVSALSSVLPLVDEGDGFYPDGSFIQHKDLPYSGTYGQVMVEGLGMLLGLVANTPWQATDPGLQKIYPLLLDAFAPLLIDGRMMDMVNGRAISRISGQNHKVGHAMLNAMLLYVPGAPKEYKSRLKALIKTQIQQDTFADFFNNPKFFSTHQLARQILNDPRIAVLPPRNQHKQFADMDRIVHHRPTWSFTLAMHSDRVGNYECINGENLKGWHTADGMTYLYNQQLDHYTGYWPLVDAYRLPGTTSLDVVRKPCSGQLSVQRDGRQSNTEWVGGSQLGNYGIAGMDFYNWNNQLHAKKSWFMFDNEVISLGADIQNHSDANAFTTMENRKISESTQVSVNGKPLENGADFNGELRQINISLPTKGNLLSYIMLQPQSGSVTRACRKANWSEIGQNKGAISGCFVTASLPHAQTTSYAYALLPDTSEVAAAQFANLPAVTVIANTGKVQAVEHPSLALFAANFWDEAKAGPVIADDPMSIMIKTGSDAWAIALSDPTRSWGKVSFKLDGEFSLESDPEQRISLGSDGQIKAGLYGLRGRSYSFTLIPNNQQNNQSH
ncbi:polysaccharide lyase 8 family protein [uncultured Photobacterium sp.]|uniref:polysaccharide lyase 8 family protein n=1 Tax=uncultured Photobacterium sp. TaxID=173973 RepID=UPI0026145E40|nr:polysaccharide lyase 8 family protein [uncultured Photobacterium sp.]